MLLGYIIDKYISKEDNEHQLLSIDSSYRAFPSTDILTSEWKTITPTGWPFSSPYEAEVSSRL